jgi:hypothetical protein
MAKYLLFNNGALDTYLAKSENLSGVRSSGERIILEFNSSSLLGAFDEVTLVVTDSARQESIINELIQNITTHRAATLVVADDRNSVYLDGISSVESISLANNKTVDNVITPTWSSNAISLKASDSGATVLLGSNPQPGTITLPTAALGLNFKVILTAPNAQEITYAGTFHGVVLGDSTSNDTDFQLLTGTALTLVRSAGSKGDRLDLVCDGSHWYFTSFGKNAGTYVVS